ncbi:BI1-like protein [Gossypium australe]|uniref:BI1-like protein n=1 Tax=Gossypium australe TaxID=47621 RepID=A0A5B6WHL7_9ROSI|nr:BI1-like protein [Gossypium australe]
MYRYERVSSTSASKADKVDLESGDTLYPGLGYGENQLRWGFIRKVYGILAAQLVLTTVVSALWCSRLRSTSSSMETLASCSSSLISFKRRLRLMIDLNWKMLWPLHVYHQKHPVNLIILSLFTVSLSLTVGVSCANTDGRIVLEALILTAGVVASLTGYTFWASKKGKDFSFLGPILFTSLIILILTGLIQMFFPLGSTSTAVYGGISALIFCGYIVYDTDNLIKRFTYDDYILASATLYLDILNLFISILRVLRSGDN